MRPSKAFISIVDQATPKMNPFITEGVAFHEMKKVLDFIDGRWEMIAPGFPKGLEYCKYTVADPFADHAERVRKKDPRSAYEISQTDFFLVHYHFRYKGEDLPPMPVYLPFCRPGGLLNIAGSVFQISPILADRVISVGGKDIFVDNGRSKIPFERTPWPIVVDGFLHEGNVVSGTLYHRKEKRYKRTTKAQASNVHYLFAQYGVEETFRRYAGCEIKIVSRNPIFDIDTTQWVVVKSKYNKISRVNGECDFMICVPRTAWEKSSAAKTLVAGLFYAADHWPTRLTIDRVLDRHHWIVLLGHVWLSGEANEIYLKEEMVANLNTLSEYLDEPVRLTLEDIGISVENFYDLLFVISDRYVAWVNESADRMMTMYGKELRLLQSVLYPITSAIMTLYYKLKGAVRMSKDRGTELTLKQITELFTAHIRPRKMYEIRDKNVEVSGVQYSGDNMFFQITCALVPQAAVSVSGARKKKKGGTISTKDRTKFTHASVAEVGSHLSFGKTEPSGRSRISPYLDVDQSTGVVYRNPKFIELLDRAQELISRKR